MGAVEDLRELIQKHDIRITLLDRVKERMKEVEFSIGENRWNLLIEDESDDFNERNQPLCLFLVLNSLDIYNETSDILEWSHEHMLKDISSWLSYYRTLEKAYSEISKHIGEITTYISPFDYELRAGEFQRLFNEK